MVILSYCREHEDIVNSHTRKRKWSKAKSHSNDFIEWFEASAMNNDISDFVKRLSGGPNIVAKKFSGYVINGYRRISCTASFCRRCAVDSFYCRQARVAVGSFRRREAREGC
ncbi:hypothetical protein G2W53_044476 [Senna tora]|uniref:Uncharacterized protein n=1 Tax=Senna tora TaxID=362788 RepID=A0A834SHR2_9FABA|nr:hypothetical protein G2W53_044476 [Senna tora]